MNVGSNMKKLSKFLVNCSLIAVTPVVANAAGTYYTGAYQSPQQRYSQQGYYPTATGYNRTTGYTAPVANQVGYTNYTGYAQQRPGVNQQVQPVAQKTAANTDKGFYLNAGISRETAMWQFDMKSAGSKLHYDNLSWNVLDVNAGYKFSMGKTLGQVDAGFKYGMQGGDSTMVDDDISNGGYLVTKWIDSNGSTIGEQIGHALSVGTSEGGSMMGFNVGFGLTDFFKIGNAKITPSIGYRYFQHKLETKNNYGLSVDTAACFEINGETQCDPAITVVYPDPNNAGKYIYQILWRDKISDPMEVGAGAEQIDPNGTYYYYQPGVSHSYTTTWAGPYLAMDFVYDINNKNKVDARVELGLPTFTSEGDQPYRFDWQHPKSVEDKTGFGGALHLGLGANWYTALTDRIMLSVGLTYDYYTASGADATTYLNGTYYTDMYNNILKQWLNESKTEADMLNPETGDQTAINIKNLETSCPGWVCNQGDEVDSFYKSMGIRVGIAAKF